ncbi:3-phenylpropionate/trans-cinnamate dioxygenase ferredoxin subunit [Polaromonas sp. OV174]|uniref:non-heme iron oxygenase ferredoxin subunit n=1 Tax=Polaromonas sp. OV174 TaxID=1855300 RepID=UPI0008EE074D|nr:non-heme iron oxygenase ferredoxin subunit [Polaromonas sp. OV174]SFB89543.1 3-phenylpropionate/trans-cinnamate dioxygenase ferredoxin subunit [Polaromonas sp. OV174]
MVEEWLDAGPETDVEEDCPVAVVVDGREVALFRVGQEVFATDNLCTHGNARLCDGYQEGREIECPLHQGRFDVSTGKALCAPLTMDVAVYPVRLIDGRIHISVAS